MTIFIIYRKWTKNVDLKEYKLVVFPINDGVHWFLVLALNLGGTSPVLYVLDSLPKNRSSVIGKY